MYSCWSKVSQDFSVVTYVAKVHPDGSMIFRSVGTVWQEWTGYGPDDLQARPGLAMEAIHPADRPSLRQANQCALTAHRPFRWEGRLQNHKGSRWISIESKPFLNADGEVLLSGVMVDISERIEAGQKPFNSQRAREKIAYAITEAIPVGTYTMVLEKGAELARFSFMSERFLELTGIEREQAEQDTMKAFACIHPEDLDDWVRLNAEAFHAKRPFAGQTRIVVKGEIRWVSAESVPRDLPEGSTIWEGVLIDVTQRVMAEKALLLAVEETASANMALSRANHELSRLAITDQLTGCHNRRFGEQSVKEQLERSRRYSEPMSLLLLDVDHFKNINDTYGHPVGDQVLIELCRKVLAGLRKVDTLARWGGEEFIVILPHCTQDQARRVADKIRRQLEASFTHPVGQVTISFGVAQLLPDDTIESLVRRADQALYTAKQTGRNRVCVAEN